jgi:hypothetical protein
MKKINIKKIPSSGSNDISEDPEILTKFSIHAVKQLYGDNKEITKFSGDNIDAFVEATGLNLTNKPDSYGVVLNYTQKKLFEAILKRLTDTNYKGDTQINNDTLLKDNYKDTRLANNTLLTGDKAPYKNIKTIPILKIKQAKLIQLCGFDKPRQGDKQDVIEALNFLSTNLFFFYWIRLKTENNKPVKDKNGDYIKEEVMEVGTLLRVRHIREQGVLQYYEITFSAPILDQVDNYFLLVPCNWRDEVKQITGKRASNYTYGFLLWLRLQYEEKRRYNANKTRKLKDFIINKSWEDIAIALKMPKSMYKTNRKKAESIIKEAYSVAIKLGYLQKIETIKNIDKIYLNEEFYPKPGQLK